MTFPRKRARSIVVDGTAYRWIVARTVAPACFCCLDQDAPVLVHVEAAAGRSGSLLRFEVEAGPRSGGVGPSAIQNAVRRARAGGWRPEIPGPVHHAPAPPG